jgi:hypothetical protein
MTPKRSKHELKRIVEDAVSMVCGLPQPGLSFVVDEVEACGRPPRLLRVWYTLHFCEQGSPFCCDGAFCHLSLSGLRLVEIGNCIRRSMNLRQQVEVTFVGRSVNVHAGVTFFTKPDPDGRPGYYGAHRSACNYHGMEQGYGIPETKKPSLEERFGLIPDY